MQHVPVSKTTLATFAITPFVFIDQGCGAFLFFFPD